MAPNIQVEPLRTVHIEEQEVELVERKGLGHPDSIADGVSESVSRALCRMYLDEFGRILHHNTDETQVVGGASEPKFGGGRVTSPIYILLVGRATTEVNGEKLPYRDVAVDAARKYVQSVCAHLDTEKQVDFDCKIGQGSVDLRGVFEQKAVLSNDTSFGVGFAPLSDTERLVLESERFLTTKLKKRLHALGEDVKVMGFRHKDEIHLTVAAALVDSELKDAREYEATCQEIHDQLATQAAKLTRRKVTIDVNTADDPELGRFYLTVTGLSMEAGDDGSVGRGNRANGLITPCRPMSLEATAGKNPVNHVGKIYNLIGNLIANDIVKEAGGDVREVHVRILSQIGKPVDDPQVAAVQILPAEGVKLAKVRPNAEAVTQKWFEQIDTIPRLLLTGKLSVF
ncbi:MAG TPA: methionine adenosyltransferase [Thermoplasmata archaeon]|nr:methionine adenosyltransferase [Thermoplasmata archaeon]HYB77102.1 methionine adenosyltransferase [Thermoplasmata archaeon]